MTVTNWIVATAAVLALVVSAVALVYSRRSAVAAEQSAREAKRANDLVEAQANRYEPNWQLSWLAGPDYIAVNATKEIAYRIKITEPGGAPIRKGVEDVPPGGSVPFRTSLGRSSRPNIKITWRRSVDGEPMSRIYTLPKRQD